MINTKLYTAQLLTACNQEERKNAHHLPLSPLHEEEVHAQRNKNIERTFDV